MNTIETLFSNLVSIKSDTGTKLELEVEKFIYNWLKDLEYFKENPKNCGAFALNDDILDRKVIWALVKGSGPDTFVLMHHHDVVDAFDFGSLQSLAYTPEKLQEALKSIDLSKEAREDLESGQWIFGRGTADMKAGAAIQMRLIEKYSKLKDFKGNLLLLSVPDEESLSVGMRGAATLLNQLKDKFSLCYSLCIDSEPHEKVDNKGIIYEGSVGKIMPVVYVRGKKAHLKDIYEGLNPVLLLSEIVKNTELNVDLSDVVENEISPPPAWNYFKDRKEVYDASIPLSSGGYFSILTLTRTPQEILVQLKSLCKEAFNSTIKFMNESYRAYCKKTNAEFHELPFKANVKTFSEIYEEALKEHGEAFIKEYEKTIEVLRQRIENGEINLPESNFTLIEKVLEYSSDLSPVVVLAFSPPYYPSITNWDFEALEGKVANLQKLVEGFGYKSVKYFMGISDMSYAALINGSETIPFIGPNMPLWRRLYYIPFEDMLEISMPVVNIGPWGKDLHMLTERVFKEDLLITTPSLIEHVINEILA